MRIFFSKAIKFFIGLLLLPILPPLGIWIWKHAGNLGDRILWMENPLSLCLGGLALWLIFSLLFRLPPRVYVFAHELTHALFVKLCGGDVKRISVKRDSGYVLSNRSNFLIVLAPYLFPFYAVALGLSAVLAGCFIPPSKFQTAVWIGIGICLGYHWTMTGKMLTTCQSDFTSQGCFFSFALIAIVNLSLLAMLLMVLPSLHGFWARSSDLFRSIAHAYHALFTFLVRHAS